MRHGMTMAPAGLVLAHGPRRRLAPRNPAERNGDAGWAFRVARTAPILLLTRPDVQAEHRLEPHDKSREARNVIASLRQRGAGLKGKAGPDAVAERGRIDDAMIRWLSSNLTAEQLERLQEVVSSSGEGAPGDDAALMSRHTSNLTNSTDAIPSITS